MFFYKKYCRYKVFCLILHPKTGCIPSFISNHDKLNDSEEDKGNNNSE